MTQATIESVTGDTPAAEIENILLRDGCVIIERLIEASFIDRMLSEIEPWMSRVPKGSGDWLGKKTRRLHGLLKKSVAIQQNVCHPLILDVVDRILLPWCDKYQLSSCSITSIGPGENAQELHRDDLMYPFSHPSKRVPHCTTFWALSDFTEDNGATRIIPGSHLWGDDYVPSQEETIPAIMAKGSVVLYLGATWHGGGSNVTRDEWRTAMYTAYNLGWLKQEEAQFLVNPPEVARHFPTRLQQLVGYQMHTPFLGWYDLQDPIVVLDNYEELSAPRNDDRPERGDGRVALSNKVHRA